jgi:hypothetical protein
VSARVETADPALDPPVPDRSVHDRSALDPATPAASAPDKAVADTSGADVDPGGENTTVDLARIGWLATVVACLIAVVILVLQGYVGYAGVTLAVAIAAAINLT